MSDNGRAPGLRDDFFRASGLQLLTAMIADVCLSGHIERDKRTLRLVRANLSEPEPKLRARLQEIYDNSESDFVRENVAAFVNMTPETFSGGLRQSDDPCEDRSALYKAWLPRSIGFDSRSARTRLNGERLWRWR
jgi:hypothetical protein